MSYYIQTSLNPEEAGKDLVNYKSLSSSSRWVDLEKLLALNPLQNKIQINQIIMNMIMSYYIQTSLNQEKSGKDLVNYKPLYSSSRSVDFGKLLALNPLQNKIQINQTIMNSFIIKREQFS